MEYRHELIMPENSSLKKEIETNKTLLIKSSLVFETICSSIKNCIEKNIPEINNLNISAKYQVLNSNSYGISFTVNSKEFENKFFVTVKMKESDKISVHFIFGSNKKTHLDSSTNIDWHDGFYKKVSESAVHYGLKNIFSRKKI